MLTTTEYYEVSLRVDELLKLKTLSEQEQDELYCLLQQLEQEESFED